MKLLARQFLAALLVCMLFARFSFGIINPKFTPVQLVQQSGEILQLRVKPDPPKGKVVFDVEKVLKGKEDAKTIDVDLTATGVPEHAENFAQMAANSTDKLALMFIAPWPDNPGVNGGDQPDAPAGQARRAFVHLDGSWFELDEDKGAWKFNKVSTDMLATWNGGGDMLQRLVKYIIDEPDEATVPVKTGMSWSTAIKAGKIDGHIAGAVPVDLNQNGAPLLFVGSDAGDHLFTCTDDEVKDVTAKFKLQSKSTAFAWGNFSGTGHLSLASWDGKSLTIYTLAADGTFTASPGAKELPECLALTPISIGSPASAGLLVTTSGSPMLLVPGPDAVAKKLVDGDLPVKDLGKPAPCLVADFDGDSWPDIVQPFNNGSFFYKGTPAGGFSAPIACPVTLGGDPAGAVVGDWNGDGMLDIFTTAGDVSRLWENQGDGHFLNKIKLTGEMWTHGAHRSAGIPCVGDINNDGWQDLLVLHNEGDPQVFFNRAFRSFGLSVSMDIGRTDLLPDAQAGQQAGCVADFTGNGCEDMAMILNDGQCVVVLRLPSESDLCAKVIVSPKSKYTGPVRVWGTCRSRTLGAWNISAGSAPAFLSMSSPGPMTIKWRFPGQAEQSKNIDLENKPVVISIDPAESK